MRDSLALPCEMGNHGRILNRAMPLGDMYLNITLAEQVRMDCKGERAEAGGHVVIQARNYCGLNPKVLSMEVVRCASLNLF